MEKFVRSYKDLSAPKGTRKKKRTFWYINYLHFVKLILLRMHFMRKVCMETQEEMLTADITYRCDECSTEYDLATAMMHVRDDQFYCERCFRDRDEINRLREVEQATSSGGGVGGGGGDRDRGAKKRRLNEKREEQMAEAPGLRDGIFELLHKIKTFPIAPPQNLPDDHIENDRADQAELEANGEDADAQGRRGGGGGGVGQRASFVNESGQSVQVKIISGGSKRDADELAEGSSSSNYATSALPAWMSKDVTGAVSSNAIQDAQERAAKRTKVSQSISTSTQAAMARGGASALLEAKMAAATGEGAGAAHGAPAARDDAPKLVSKSAGELRAEADADEYESTTFVTVRGVRKALKDITKEDQDSMDHNEYEQWAALVQRKAAAAVDDQADDDEDDVDFS